MKNGQKKMLNTDKFIQKAIKVHGHKYDYSKVNYKNHSTKIIIRCLKHGEYKQKPTIHLMNRGCQECGREKCKNIHLKNTEWFLKNANKIHKNKFDYSKVKYINAHTKVKIICKKHGEFSQQPYVHMAGHACPNCSIEKVSSSHCYNTKIFIKLSKKVHNNKYDYSMVEYMDTITKVKIKCNKCKIYFMQSPGNHLQNHGCSICKESKGERKIRDFLEINKIKYIAEKRFKDCRNKLPLPFDFYLSEYNTCIEYDGTQHFRITTGKWKGNDKILNLVKNRDKIKNKYCKKNKIDLIRIPYTEFNNIETILEKQLS